MAQRARRLPAVLLGLYALWWAALAIAPSFCQDWLLPWLFMVSHATLYELIEMSAALAFGGELGQAYLGTQGDVWDAQKDSALAAIGAAIAVLACRWPRAPG